MDGCFCVRQQFLVQLAVSRVAEKTVKHMVLSFSLSLSLSLSFSLALKELCELIHYFALSSAFQVIGISVKKKIEDTHSPPTILVRRKG
jgi:hypothetical protein